MKRFAMFSLLLGLAAAAGAQQMGGQGMMGGHGTASDQAGGGAMMGGAKQQMGAPGMMGQGATPLADGEVRKVDRDARKITIRHGAIAHMDMPPMTMVYQVKDAAMLDHVKAGDKVKFAADKIGGAYVVTRIESPK